jgi:hypothetical protein
MCPSSATNTSFYTFTPGAKAKASETNNNFSVFRGHIIPINPDTVTSSDNSHDLGAADHRWRNIYVNNAPVIATQTANTVWASGSAAAGVPAFRALVNADMPASIVAMYTRGSGTFSTGTNQIAGISTQVIDTNSAFASDTFTAPIAGKYLVSLNVEFSPRGTADYFFTRVYKGAGAYPAAGANLAGVSGAAAGNTTMATGTKIVSLAAGETLTFYTVASGSTSFTAVEVCISLIR